MLPRPRLVCEEPGLRPIGRSPGVPDKSTWGLGSMFQYSVNISICSVADIFQFFYSSVGSVGKFAGLPPCSALCHCPLWSDWVWSSDNQRSQHAPLRCKWSWKHNLAFLPQHWWNWQIKLMKSVSMGIYQYKNQVNGEFLTVFQTRIWTDSSNDGFRSSQVVLKFN